MSRAHLESRQRAALPWLTLAGLALPAAGGLILTVSHSLTGGFAGLFLLIMGCALLTPPLVVGLTWLNQPLTARLGLLARMANRDVARHLSRTGIAVAALMAALATTVGVGVMVEVNYIPHATKISPSRISHRFARYTNPIQSAPSPAARRQILTPDRPAPAPKIHQRDRCPCCVRCRN